MAKQDFPKGLKEQLPIYAHVLATRVLRPAHLIPDIVSLSLGREIYEHSLATLTLWNSPCPRAAYACARGAFENFQDLVYLMHAESYDLVGSRARAAELLDVEHSRKLQVSALAASGKTSPPAERTVDEALAIDAAVWEQVAPGKADILHRALDDVREFRRRRRFHWSGMTRADLHREMVQILGGEDMDPVFRAWYNQLSLFTHPSLHSGPEYLSPQPDGTVVFGTPTQDGMPLGTAFIATTLAATLLVEKLPGNDQ